ncbi:MAG: histone H1 [Phycisphaerales bacterium]|nr:histone H1 [Phycisphaerales bacterium]
MIMQSYEKLLSVVNNAREDIEKAGGGNRAAGTRARKHMQEVRAAAQEVRNAILAARETPPKA